MWRMQRVEFFLLEARSIKLKAAHRIPGLAQRTHSALQSMQGNIQFQMSSLPNADNQDSWFGMCEL